MTYITILESNHKKSVVVKLYLTYDPFLSNSKNVKTKILVKRNNNFRYMIKVLVNFHVPYDRFRP